MPFIEINTHSLRLKLVAPMSRDIYPYVSTLRFAQSSYFPNTQFSFASIQSPSGASATMASTVLLAAAVVSAFLTNFRLVHALFSVHDDILAFPQVWPEFS